MPVTLRNLAIIKRRKNYLNHCVNRRVPKTLLSKTYKCSLHYEKRGTGQLRGGGVYVASAKMLSPAFLNS